MVTTDVERKHGEKQGLRKGMNTWAKEMPRYKDGTFMPKSEFEKLKVKK